MTAEHHNFGKLLETPLCEIVKHALLVNTGDNVISTPLVNCDVANYVGPYGGEVLSAVVDLVGILIVFASNRTILVARSQ